MSFEDIEKQLTDLRQQNELTYSYFVEHGLSRNAMLNIERQGNYLIDSLFKYLEILNYCIIVNGTPVMDQEEFGNALKNERMNRGLSQMDILNQQKIGPTRIVSIEKGRSFRRSSLLSYLEILGNDINFSVKSIIDVV